MTETITLKLNNEFITLSTHTLSDGRQLFKAQDLLHPYFKDLSTDPATGLNNWVKAKKVKLGLMDPKTRRMVVPKEIAEAKLSENGIVSFPGRTGGTYLTKRELLKLAGYIDEDFENAVYEAFEFLTEGLLKEAADLAWKFARLGTKKAHIAASDKLKDTHPKSYGHLVAQSVYYVTGSSPADLKKNRVYLSPKTNKPIKPSSSYDVMTEKELARLTNLYNLLCTALKPDASLGYTIKEVNNLLIQIENIN